ncbi:hypothetical protein Acsp04_60890 [Actinomadura sp. NBRC 104425]|uniref:hypothetical protein n=1 Tax=Actinomadura sp. NBRC 104425 TaxID=3032204 RepID=UPI0024A3C8BB|nr:hypothetical protein [Actinomadura sp. NBRC 104425]GLZ15854.1 hypothetical protein Acsp04_60890 [Actinomadura sp. NBRC 104425]
MGGRIEAAGGAALDRAAVATVSKIGPLVPPWAVLLIVWPLALVAHVLWGEPPAVAWVAMAGTLIAVILAALTWLVSHGCGILGRVHSTVTAGGAMLWFTVATITGPTSGFALAAWFFGGGGLAAAWNIRAVIRAKNTDSADTDPLGGLFDKAKERFGLKGASVKTREVDDHAIKGTLQLPPGERTQSDMLKKTETIESGLRFPPGSVVLAPHEDDASKMHITVTDPRMMRRPIPWPGPSKPGASIAEPLRIGVYQDATPALLTLPGTHLQIMGMTGSGKSIGGGWNILGEAITRSDVATFVADLAKSDQTVGPLTPAITRFIKTKPELVALIRALVRIIPERTAWLAEHGYQRWAPGCGLTYWIVWLEEAAKIFDELGSREEELLLQVLKEARSAGCSIILSLQRADYSQMPTIARAQLARMTFGVASTEDSGFGLSERQQAADCAPELWGSHQPGMAYLDAPGVPETHYAVPLRTYAWGADDQDANAAMREHAARYPAAARDMDMDEFTTRLADSVGTGPRVIQATTVDQEDDMRDDRDEDTGDAIADYLGEPDPDPDLADVAPDAEIKEPTAEEAERFVIPEPTAQKMSPQAARRLLADWLKFRARGGRHTFTASDPELLKVRDATGNRSRAWAYKVLRELVDLGVLAEDDAGPTTRYTIADLSALDRDPVAV